LRQAQAAYTERAERGVRVGHEGLALWRIGQRARALPEVQDQQRREWARLMPPMRLPGNIDAGPEAQAVLRAGFLQSGRGHERGD